MATDMPRWRVGGLFLNLFLAVLVFVAARGLSLVVVHGLLIAVASLAAEHRL